MSDGVRACWDCAFWQLTDPVLEFDVESWEGKCRRSAPLPWHVSVNDEGEGYGDERQAFWPITWGSDWCGEYRDARRTAEMALAEFHRKSEPSDAQTTKG